MTLELLRGIGTVLAIVAFGGICWWAYGARRQAGFAVAANLPFADDERKESSS